MSKKRQKKVACAKCKDTGYWRYKTLSGGWWSRPCEACDFWDSKKAKIDRLRDADAPGAYFGVGGTDDGAES